MLYFKVNGSQAEIQSVKERLSQEPKISTKLQQSAQK
jgi:hypothetical protein